jgi:hypothetical protein
MIRLRFDTLLAGKFWTTYSFGTALQALAQIEMQEIGAMDRKTEFPGLLQ